MLETCALSMLGANGRRPADLNMALANPFAPRPHWAESTFRVPGKFSFEGFQSAIRCGLG